MFTAALEVSLLSLRGSFCYLEGQRSTEEGLSLTCNTVGVVTGNKDCDESADVIIMQPESTPQI